MIRRFRVSDAIVTSFVFHDDEYLIFAVSEIAIHLTQIHRTLNSSIQQVRHVYLWIVPTVYFASILLNIVVKN